MTLHLSRLIAWGCLAVLLAAPVAAGYLLFDLEQFAAIAQKNLQLPIQWPTVGAGQWYLLWAVTVLYLVPTLLGLHFLRRAFNRFANNELFNENNSKNLRLFSICLMVQALCKPVHLAAASVILSWQHPPGKKTLVITFGSSELITLALAVILWVVSDLLVKSRELEQENKAFI
jgi:hypothetical protein